MNKALVYLVLAKTESSSYTIFQIAIQNVHSQLHLIQHNITGIYLSIEAKLKLKIN